MKSSSAPLTSAFIGLGANLGDAQTTLMQALSSLNELPTTQLVNCSRLYRTAPVDSSGPDYINAVAEVLTRLQPEELLVALQELEDAAGRVRPYRNAPRSLDLDILLFGDEVRTNLELTIPHPRMFERAFVLLPLFDIAPNKVSAAQLSAVAGQTVTRIA